MADTEDIDQQQQPIEDAAEATEAAEGAEGAAAAPAADDAEIPQAADEEPAGEDDVSAPVAADPEEADLSTDAAPDAPSEDSGAPAPAEEPEEPAGVPIAASSRAQSQSQSQLRAAAERASRANLAAKEKESPFNQKFDGSTTEDMEFQLAKAYLLKVSPETGMNLYDHMSSIVMRVLEQRPDNPVDVFESISLEAKRGRFQAQQPEPAPAKNGLSLLGPGTGPFDENSRAVVELAKAQAGLLKAGKDGEKAGEQGEVEIPNFVELHDLFEAAGVTFGKEEIFRLTLSINELVATKPIKNVRIFGKIFGVQSNYIIVESEAKGGEAIEEDPALASPGAAAPESSGGDATANEKPAEQVDDGSAPTEAPLPKPKVKKLAPLPKETGTGANKFIYWVTSHAGGEWRRLPDVTPEAIQASRKIRKLFTGRLENPINSYPPFPGNEALYLRAQIARIVAATVISPAGYYTFDADENEDESEGNSNIMVNPEYEVPPQETLVDVANWVHHAAYILPQGRTTWTKPTYLGNANDGGQRDDEEDPEEVDDEERDENEEGEFERESGPPLLSSLAEDTEVVENVPAWSSRVATSLMPIKFSPVYLRSNRWPGAVAVAYNDKHTCVYVGYGHKDIGGPYRSAPLPPMQTEYAESEENPQGGIVEASDPTVEEERAAEEARRDAEEKPESDGEDGDNNEDDG